MPSAADEVLTATHILHEVSLQKYPVSALYVIATPIGNVGDITLRALHVLSLVDAVACEDTRNTGQLLSRYGISKPLIAAHQHNEREVATPLIDRLRDGQRIALVSDAGTPAISDPGARIVDAVRAAGLRIIPLPGASSPIAALSVGGLVNDHFHFASFLPAAATQRKNMLDALKKIQPTLIFFEAPHRIADTLKTIIEVFEPERHIVVARELSKLFEEIHRCKISEVAQWFAADPRHGKGEFVLLIEGAPPQNDGIDVEADRVLAILLSDLPVSQAAALAARITGHKKNALYQRALALKS